MTSDANMTRPSRAHKDRHWRRRVLPMMIAGCFGYGAACANPVGPTVVNGQVSFANQGNLLSITNSPGSIINWQNFSIGAGDITRFIQQNSSSSVLNRITGQDPSHILGALQSNGRVFLINPNGIVFGQGAQVDVNGLVASTLNIGNDDFLAGKWDFKAGDKAATLQNQGTITTPAGGQVYLIAPNVENSGIITSPKGEVVLAAGHTVQLVDSANPDVQVVVSAPDSQALNLGQIVAHSGKVGIYGALVNQRGIVNADSAVVGENGKIVFKASRDTILDAGSASSAAGAGAGGEIHVLGDRVALLGDAKVNVSGQQGGGTVLVGGDNQGQNPAIRNAKQSYVGKDVQIKADGLANGDGGKVIVWADDATRAYGDISARAGVQGGNGGFIETSGHYLDVAGARVSAAAGKGKGGTWLLDPWDVTLSNNVNVGASFTSPGTWTGSGTVAASTVCVDCAGAGVAAVLNAGTSVIINSGVDTANGNAVGLGTGNGNITVAAPINWVSTSQLSLYAYKDIAINDAISGVSGTLVARSYHGNISQAAAIAASALFAYADAGAVTLTSAGNSVGTLAGYAAASPGFNFVNSSALTVDAVVDSHGVFTNNQPISLTANSGNLTIADAAYGIKSGSGSISLTATSGSVLETTGLITGNALTVTAGSAINLASASNVINTLTASQTSAGGAGIAFNNNRSYSITSVSNAAVSGGVSLNTTGGSAFNIDVGGPVTTSSSGAIAINAGGTGAVTRSGSGVLNANSITLQSSSTGAIGASGSPLLTSSVSGGNADIHIGYPGAGPAAVYVSHTGDAFLDTLSTFSANAPLSVSASNNLVVHPALNAGTSDLALSAGNLLTIEAGATLAGANITLSADHMDLKNASGTTNAGSGTIWLKPTSASWDVDLGSALDNNGYLALSTNELNTLAGTGILRLGATTAGNLNVSAAIAPAYAGSVSLQSGGNITQAAAGTISTTKLALTALGDVSLNTAANAVTDIAAHIGDGTHQNRNFKFKNAGALNVAANIDGMSGISISLDTAGYDPLSQNGVIALESTGGALSQSVAATLSGRAVNATGNSGVILQEANPTGVISGSSSSGDFKYRSANAVDVNTVNGYSGINAGTGAVSLTADAGAISGGSVKGASLSASASDGINLTTQVGTLSAVNSGTASNIAITNTGALSIQALRQSAPTGSGSITVDNTGALTVAFVDGGVIVGADAGAINLTAHSPLTVNGRIVSGAGNITLLAGASGTPGAGDTLTIGATGFVTSGSGNISLTAGDGIVIANAANVSTGTGTLTTTPNLNGTSSPTPTPTPTPTLAQCTTDPTLAGCTQVLPTLSQCAATPTLAGCSAVLPSVAACIADPAAAGCTTVLPNLAACVANPAAAGCTAVLPSVAACVANPAAAGCTAVLPSVAACVANPAATGCTVVLPSVTACVANPAAPGCTVVLPTLAACVANPATAGCSVVMPTFSQCTLTPSLAGCTIVLPTLAQCTATPTLTGCSAVLPTASQCAAAPTQAGCETVLPTTQTGTNEPIKLATNSTINIINTSTATVTGLTAAGKDTGTGKDDKTSDSKKDEKKKDDKKDTTGSDKIGAKNDDAAKKMYCN